MRKEFKLPELGEHIRSATVVGVLVSPGDTVAVDQGLLSLETDKAEFELPSTVAGTVAEVLVGAGDEIEVGQVVLRMEVGEAGDDSERRDARPIKATETETVGAAGADSGTASKDATDDAGRKREQAPPPGRPMASVPRASAQDDQGRPQAPAGPIAGRAVAAAPSVRRLARELGIDIHVVPTGDDGYVSANDVRRFVRASDGGQQPSFTSVATATPLPDFRRWGEIDVKPMSKIRRRTADNMARAWVEIPQVTHYDVADITELDRLRKRYTERVKRAGGNLTWTAILLNVLAGALKRFPQFNTSVDLANNAIIYKRYIHIGVAVDTERGLLVPVIRDANRKNIVQLAKELHDVSEAARQRNIRPDMMEGATFTITNLGGVGGVGFSPIVNPPQVAILGVSRSSLEPRYADGTLEPRLMLPLSLSYDHRVIDGADAARFLRWVCEALREPFLLELEGD